MLLTQNTLLSKDIREYVFFPGHLRLEDEGSRIKKALPVHLFGRGFRTSNSLRFFVPAFQRHRRAGQLLHYRICRTGRAGGIGRHD